MTTKFSTMLDNKNCIFACKALDYYDGEQEEWVKRALDVKGSGRKDWQARGIQPRYRNIVKMIVDKSGLLFNDGPPKMEVYNGEEVNQADSTKLNDLLFAADWAEFYTNADSITRMLKTVMVLVQWDADEGHFFFDLLHSGNSAVTMVGTRIDTLVYRTRGDHDSDEKTLRVITKDIIQDIHVAKNGEETIINVEPNPYGIIPVAPWHDTNTPRVGYWNKMPRELIQINEMYNLHLIDSEYTASWIKLPSLFTNAELEGGNSSGFTEEVAVFGQALPRTLPSQGALQAGPSKIIQFSTMGGATPFVDYKGPVVDLAPLDTMFGNWVRDFAADWSVNVKNGAVATSGFQLIVEEIDNLQLRKQRQRMAEAHFHKLYEVIRVIAGFVGISFSDSVLVAKFNDPVLPVDNKAEEEVWSLRIQNGRASRVDYFMVTKGMSQTDAEAKVAEIDGYRTANQNVIKAAAVPGDNKVINGSM